VRFRTGYWCFISGGLWSLRYKEPLHPYTKALISAVPIPDPKIERTRTRIKLAGELPSPLDPDAALRFLPSKLGAPGYQPALEQPRPGHFVAEHDPIESLLVF